MSLICKGRYVAVKSGNKAFNGVVQEVIWDFDQWAYKVDGEWYCQSEVSELESKEPVVIVKNA